MEDGVFRIANQTNAVYYHFGVSLTKFGVKIALNYNYTIFRIKWYN